MPALLHRAAIINELSLSILLGQLTVASQWPKIFYAQHTAPPGDLSFSGQTGPPSSTILSSVVTVTSK